MIRGTALLLAVCAGLWSGLALAGHYDLADAKFISSEDAGKLEKAGIADTELLLTTASTPEGRAGLAKKSGVSVGVLERYVRMCDLLRVDGVGPGMAMLFHEVGITSVAQLKDSSVNPLHKKLLETNDSRHIMGVVPQVETLEAWIAQAAKLPVVVK